MLNLPTHVEHEGIKYPINTDFRVALQCLELSRNEDIDNLERVVGIVTMLFGKEIPVDETSIRKAMYFLQMGETQEEQEAKPPVIDFEQDKSLIYGSFLSQYNIRLKEEKVHWWEFMHLLSAIDPKTPLGQVVSIRSLDLNEIKDPEIRKHYAELKKSVAIEQEVDEDVKAFMEELYG